MSDHQTEPIRILLLGEPSTRPEGLERALARSGFRLLESLESAPPHQSVDLRLLTLANADGLDDALGRADGGTAPIVVVLGSGRPADVVRALSLGAADALVAPVHLPELEARLRARAGQAAQPATTSVLDAVQEIWANVRNEEILRALVRRVGQALDLSHCSIILTRPGNDFGRVVAEYDRPAVRDFRLDLERYPEVLEAVRTSAPVVVPDTTVHPLFDEIRRQWAEEQLEVPVRSVVALPVRRADEVVGVFLLRPRDPQIALSSAQLGFADGLARTAAGLLYRRSGAGPHEAPDDAVDQLTGCATLPALELRLNEEFARANRYALTFSLVLVDVDSLAHLNAERGAEAGDRLLAELGSMLQRELRGPDFVARYGGDEFALVLPETGTDGARQSLERVRRRLESEPFSKLLPDAAPRLTAGIATFPHPAVLQPDDLLALAEAALLRGKGQAEERTGTAESVLA